MMLANYVLIHFSFEIEKVLKGQDGVEIKIQALASKNLVHTLIHYLLVLQSWKVTSPSQC